MAEKKEKKSKKEVSLKIYARVRGLMPWEPKKVSLKVQGNSVQNKAGKIVNQYAFVKVFKPDSTNEQCFKVIALPMISNVLNGFNAVLIAYGQTGSGKTFSMLGKPKLNIVGILPRMLEYMVNQKQVQKVELSAVEAFGHHVAKIALYDLFDEENQVKEWDLKKGDTGLDMMKARVVSISTADDAHSKIIYAHAASHFAPTGKNPESSRGHVTFVSKIYLSTENKHEEKISYFVMVDCAGSEGETAFTEDFKSRVSKQTLMCRRLEAGTINTGLSQLQVVFNQLRLKGKLTKTIGNGLRRVLHPYINTRTYLSVLFTLSPSINNSKATESTLKFAVTAGMVKVKPVQTKGKVNFKQLVAELQSYIDEQQKIIEENKDTTDGLNRSINRLKDALSRAAKQNNNNGGGNDGDKVLKKRRVVKKKQVMNDDGQLEEIEESEEEEYFTDADGNEIKNNSNDNNNTNNTNNTNDLDVPELKEEVQDALMDVLDNAAKELSSALGVDYQITSNKANTKSGHYGRQRTVTAEENDEAMKLALEQYSKLTVPWQKEQFLQKKKKEFEKKKKEKEELEKKENKLKKSASQGLLLIDEQIQQAQSDYKRLEDKQKNLQKKLSDPNCSLDKEELTEHAMQLQVMLEEQKAITENLKMSKTIIIEYLNEDGRQALVQFFKMKKLI